MPVVNFVGDQCDNKAGWIDGVVCLADAEKAVGAGAEDAARALIEDEGEFENVGVEIGRFRQLICIQKDNLLID